MALSCPLGAASLVSVSDNSVAEWDALPQAYVFEAACPENASHKALKSVKVYADAQYINVLVEADRSYFDADEWVPLHMYIDTDNSDATGGYSDEFTDANADIILETAVFYEGQAYNYNPAVFKWWGEIGGSGWQWTDPEAEHGADDYWGAIVGESMLPVGASQMVDGRIEIQIDRFFIPAEWNNTGFGIGFDILHNWSAVGILPQGPAVSSANNPVPENLGRVAKMKVLIDGAAANIQVIEGIRFLLDEDAKTAQIIGFVDPSDIEDTDKGPLMKEASFFNTQLAQEKRELVKSGVVYQFSFAYDVLEAGPVELEDGVKAYEIKKIELFEISIVPLPPDEPWAPLPAAPPVAISVPSPIR